MVATTEKIGLIIFVSPCDPNADSVIWIKLARVSVDDSSGSTLSHGTDTQMDYLLGFLSGSILTLASCAAWFTLLEWL
jgi:hypothetical protein